MTPVPVSSLFMPEPCVPVRSAVRQGLYLFDRSVTIEGFASGGS
jgi:hypothetical protein